MIISHFNVTFFIYILKFLNSFFFFYSLLKSTKNKVQMPHKHSVTYVIKGECETEKAQTVLSVIYL